MKTVISTKTVIHTIRSLLTENKVNDAFEKTITLLETTDFYNEAITHIASYHRLKDARRQGLLSWDTANTGINNVYDAILKILDLLESEVKDKQSLSAELDKIKKALVKDKRKPYLVVLPILLLLISVILWCFLSYKDYQIKKSYDKWRTAKIELMSIQDDYGIFVKSPNDNLKSTILRDLESVFAIYDEIELAIADGYFKTRWMPVYLHDLQIIHNTFANLTSDSAVRIKSAKKALEQGKLGLGHLASLEKKYQENPAKDKLEIREWMKKERVREDILLQQCIALAILYKEKKEDQEKVKTELQNTINQITKDFIEKYSNFKTKPILDTLIQREIIHLNY